MVPRVRNTELFSETNSTPQGPYCTPRNLRLKVTANMMITYYEFHKYNLLVKPQFVHKMLTLLRTKKCLNMI